MKFTKSRNGAWAKGAEIKSGAKCKVIDEAVRIESQFTKPDGTVKMQDVMKVHFVGAQEPVNVSLNRATIYGLIDAYGDDSKLWIGKTLTAHTEKTTVAGKRVTALYLLADGFEVGEDENGYVTVKKVGESFESELPSDDEDIQA